MEALFPSEIAIKIYEYDSTYHEKYKNNVKIFNNIYKYCSTMVTRKGNTVYIYYNDDTFCASTLSPFYFLNKNIQYKISNLTSKKYGMNFEFYNKELGIKMWFFEGLQDFIFQKLFLHH